VTLPPRPALAAGCIFRVNEEDVPSRLRMAYHTQRQNDARQRHTLRPKARMATCPRRTRAFAGDPLQETYSWSGAAPQEVEAVLRKQCGPGGPSRRLLPVFTRCLSDGQPHIHPYGCDATACPRLGTWADGGVSAAATFASVTEECRLNPHESFAARIMGQPWLSTVLSPCQFGV
jgi:hypothetical protein